jgi:hypothetical protein
VSCLSHGPPMKHTSTQIVTLTGKMLYFCFDNKHFLISHIGRHLLTQFDVANGKNKFNNHTELSVIISCNCIQ